MTKPKHIKPGLYALYYEYLKDIAKFYGYNLVVHGSMNRDLDLVAIPWEERCTFETEQNMIKEIQEYLTGRTTVRSDNNLVDYSEMPGGRHAYVIPLNLGNKHGEWVRFENSEYYLDISIAQTYNHLK